MIKKEMIAMLLAGGGAAAQVGVAVQGAGHIRTLVAAAGGVAGLSLIHIFRRLRHGICVAKMLDKTSSIICAFGLAAAAPRSPYRHLELCGIALTPTS